MLVSQRAQYPLIKEYSFNHNMNPLIFLWYIPKGRGIGLSGVVSLSIFSKPWGLCHSSGVCVGLGFPVCGVGLGGHGSLTIPPLEP